MFTTSLSTAGAPDQLDEQLTPFAPLIGKTGKANSRIPTPEKRSSMCPLGARAHGKQFGCCIVNDGVYGGETIITWDAQEEQP